MDNSFLTLGDTGDEMSYFRQILQSAQQKSESEGYAERRAAEMANGDPDDCDIGEELTLAMEEITENEKDYKSLIEITTCLFERS